jgi:hypothetical protein
MEPRHGFWGDDQFLYVDATAEYSSLEGWGLHLFNTVARRLRFTLREIEAENPSFMQRGDQIPEGPDFIYESAAALFQGRRGRGPIFVAWDTNLLLDYFEYGRYLWEDNELPDRLGEEYVSELEGLQFVMALWVLRDIRFMVFPESVVDATKKLSLGRRASRLNAFHEFTSALRLVSYDSPKIDLPSRDGLLLLPDSFLQRAVARIPHGFDRVLVNSAAQLGLHVFMTRDKGILSQRDSLKPFGLLLASPLDLLEELVGCGAFHCMLEPRYAYWPMPDQMRVGHLIRALPNSSS